MQEENAEHQRALQSSEAKHNLSLCLEAEAGQIKLKITRVFIRVSLITGTHLAAGGRVDSLAPKVFTSRHAFLEIVFSKTQFIGLNAKVTW